MSWTWPDFMTPQPLADGRTWTATFESYDQYRELCYYRVSVGPAEITAQIGTEFAGDDWTVPAFMTELIARLAEAAAGA